jgi:MoaA/NifB/PqqE/SkfB family radical SAM enzyme
MTDKERALKSKSFCAALWTSLYQSPNGDVSPCCVWDMNKPLGNVNNTSLDSIFKSDRVLKLKNRMLSDKPLHECNYCNKMERDTGDDSSRSFFKNEFFDSIDWDSSDTKFVYWDLRISNLCNFKCRMCYHDLSSAWYDDVISLNSINTNKNKRELPNNRIIKINDKSKFWNELEQHYNHVESIYFAGGEPFINEHHFKILQDLIDKNLSKDIKLIVNTNLSTTKFKNKDVLDYYTNFNHIVFGFSIDGSYEIGEYIRSGLNYVEWKKNVKEFVEFVKNRNTLNITYLYQFAAGVSNIHNICDFIWDLYKDGLIVDSHCKFNFQPIINPQEQSCKSLPPTIFKKFKSDYQLLRTKLYENNVSNQFINSLDIEIKSLINFVESNPFDVRYLNDFYKKQIELDKIRGENIFDILPDYRKIPITNNGTKLI